MKRLIGSIGMVMGMVFWSQGAEWLEVHRGVWPVASETAAAAFVNSIKVLDTNGVFVPNPGNPLIFRPIDNTTLPVGPEWFVYSGNKNSLRLWGGVDMKGNHNRLTYKQLGSAAGVLAYWQGDGSAQRPLSSLVINGKFVKISPTHITTGKVTQLYVLAYSWKRDAHGNIVFVARNGGLYPVRAKKTIVTTMTLLQKMTKTFVDEAFVAARFDLGLDALKQPGATGQQKIDNATHELYTAGVFQTGVAFLGSVSPQ